jgi:hypothetical protein
LNGLLAFAGTARPARSLRASQTSIHRVAARSAGTACLRNTIRTVYSIQAGKNYRWNTVPGTSLTSSFHFLFEQPLPLAPAFLSNPLQTRGFDTTSKRRGLLDTLAVAQGGRADAKKPVIAMNTCSWNTRSTQCTGYLAALSAPKSKSNQVDFRSMTSVGAQSLRTQTLRTDIPLRTDMRMTASRWCPEEDSNLHTFRHTDLNRARLPIPPSGHCCDETFNAFVGVAQQPSRAFYRDF